MTKQPISLFICGLFGISLWLVFYPGVFSVDSLGFVHAAAFGRYFDWQPILMPVLLSLAIRIGGSIGWVALGQAMTGLFGVRQLVIETGRFLRIGQHSQLDFMASIILLVLSSPLSVFPIYLVTLWTDIWLAIFLIWAIAILLNICQESLASNKLGFSLKVFTLVGLLGLAMLLRYNALILIPVVIIAIERALARTGVKPPLRVLVALAPLAIVLVFRAYQSRFLQIESDHPEHVVYALDLASMLLQDPSICHDLSLNSCDMVLGAFPNEFSVGNGAIDNTFNQGRQKMPNSFLVLFNYPGLEHELVQEIRDYPLLWISVKLSNYFDYLRPDSTRFFYPERILENDVGLSYASSDERGRIAWFSMTDWVSRNPVLRWFSFVHSVWLIINILGLFICLIMMWRKQRKAAAFLGLIFTIPLVYYGSYLLALTASDFRFMYPSTLIMQVISLTILFSLLLRARAGKMMRGMNNR